MAENSTIARPYAQAVFDLAKEKSAYQSWSEALQFAAEVTQVPAMAEVIASPHVSKTQVAEIFIEACGAALDAAGQNLIRILADNGRLILLPEIVVLYEIYRAEAEGTVAAEVTSAFELNAAQQSKLAAALSKKLGREVTLSCSVDNSLLGGVIVRAGDVVIDGSALGKLDKLAAEMNG